MKVKDQFSRMTPYERMKLVIDFLRLIAMIVAPPAAVWLNHLAKEYLGW